MSPLRSFFRQPFIIATSVAAFFHSTWSLATLFAGREPAMGWGWLLWVAPAALIAFAIDIGLVSVSADMRRGERGRWKYITFIALAASTYVLQLLYISAHMPVVDLGPGVAERAQGFVLFVRDFSVYMLPALLPLSTTIYTFSYSRSSDERAAPKPTPLTPSEKPSRPALGAPQSGALPAITSGESDGLLFPCPECDKRFASLNALNAHRRAHKVKGRR